MPDSSRQHADVFDPPDPPEADRYDGKTCTFCGADCPVKPHLLRIPDKKARRELERGWLLFRRQTRYIDPNGKLHDKGIEQLACPRCWIGSDSAFISKLNRKYARWTQGLGT